ncbi:RagB/SusD family nutrient uptake outer membrane protein [Chitinophaga sp. Hz27]|uniref:RagB/SusD family nutrient uptake outer membrane protein n=1 Tax=Chitinophaga sp. Hz27 TaxID=3347169 RepID=UPI0035E0ADF3
MYNNNVNKYAVSIVLVLSIILSACSKLVEVAPPRGSINANNAFNSDAKINAAVSAIYAEMINENEMTLTSGAMSCYGGILADELLPVKGAFSSQYDMNYYSGNILRDDPNTNSMWNQPYHIIYTANSVLEGLAAYSNVKGVTDSIRRIAAGEAKFARAFCYFYLVNTYGDVPLLTSTNINENLTISRTATDKVYDLIIADLKDAQQQLSYGYGYSAGKKVMPNQLAATALLARVYLYRQRWSDAAQQASIVINSNVYTLTTPDATFKPNNNESIWELSLITNTGSITSLNEGKMMVPPARLSLYPDLEPMFTDSAMFEINTSLGFTFPAYALTTATYNVFEPSDLRAKYWTDRVLTPTTAPYFGDTVRYVSKYAGVDFLSTGVAGDLVNMVLRFSEMYLIRAEALAHGAESAGDAIADVNIIRNRAGLPNLTAIAGDQLLDAIAKENRLEFLGEWGHRWMDLKRTGKATDILGKLSYKQPWDGHSLLLPLPQAELANSPNLKQNQGY